MAWAPLVSNYAQAQPSAYVLHGLSSSTCIFNNYHDFIYHSITPYVARVFIGECAIIK